MMTLLQYHGLRYAAESKLIRGTVVPITTYYSMLKHGWIGDDGTITHKGREALAAEILRINESSLWDSRTT